ncbi:MAG: hypothetical protein KGR19_04395 [Acidobacteria bacterium]|nr:hypothetical protein [Solirubrobacteraceae bacterium]MBU6337040.1 hypothetical protein [Acidobacteriota bacterium]
MSSTAIEKQPDTDPRELAAWERYRSDLDGLDGGEYEEAEQHAWDRLQADLLAISREAEPEHSSIGL